MKKYFTALFGALIFMAPFAMVQAFSSEVHIAQDGKASISSAKVMQIAGGTLFTRLYWGDAFVRLTVKTNTKTKFFRGTNEVTTIAEVGEGNLLDISGELESGTDSLSLVATSIKNSSVQKEQATFSGKVTAVDLSARAFTLETKKSGIITVNVSANTTFIKGSRTVDIGHVQVGDTITKTSGEYDIPTKVLTVTQAPVVIYINLAQFKPQTFVGTIADMSAATSTPASLKIMINKISYTVNLNNKTEVMNKARKSVGLNRFVAGDAVRLYGAIRQSDDPFIDDVEVLRNMSL